MSLITSVLTGGSNNHETTSEEANAVYTDFVSEGIVGSVGNTSGVAPATGGFAVNATGTPDTNVQVTAGVAYVTATPTSQSSQTFRVKNSATEAVAISANSSGSTKYDWVYIKLDATNLNTPNTAGDNAATLVTSRSSSAASDDGTPPTYGYPIAVVTVANGFSTITNSNIRDIRSTVALNTGTNNAVDGWTSLATTLTTATGYNKGNREYELTTASDMSAVVSPGMRFKVTRATTPPTQCTDLESGSSQYASLVSGSVTGVSFTDDYTAEAWVKLESYSSDYAILSRWDGTNGWMFRIMTGGTVEMYGKNSGGTADTVGSNQSIPLGKWVHVAATIDLSGATGTIYIDGVSVAVTYTSGTSTSITNTGPLNIGARNSASNYFDGKIADVRLWSVVRTATQIRDNMNQQLVGNETNLVAYYKLDGSFTDSTSNANNLTGQAGAVATNADNPMNATEYGIVTAVDSNSITVFTGTNYNIPNATLSTPYYSTQKIPFGFPGSKGKWQVSTISYQTSAVTISATYGAPSFAEKLVVPTGAWQLTFDALIRIDSTATSTRTMIATLSSDGTTETNPLTNVTANHDGEAAAAANAFTMARSEDFVDLSAQTTFTLLAKVPTTANTNTSNIDGALGNPILIRATCAYL